MREAIINIIKYRLAMGLTKEEIVTGLTFTLCETLDITKQELLIMILKEKPHVDHIGNYEPPKTFNLFEEFKTDKFKKIMSIKDLTQPVDLNQSQPQQKLNLQANS